MDLPSILSGMRSLSIDDRIRLMNAIRDSLAADREREGLTEAQKEELDRRLADMEANPDDDVPWEEVYAESLKRVRG